MMGWTGTLHDSSQAAQAMVKDSVPTHIADARRIKDVTEANAKHVAKLQNRFLEEVIAMKKEEANSVASAVESTYFQRS